MFKRPWQPVAVFAKSLFGIHSSILSSNWSFYQPILATTVGRQKSGGHQQINNPCLNCIFLHLKY